MDFAPTDDRPIEGERLTAWTVLAGGMHVRMDFIGTDRTPRRIVLSFDALSSLLMTLPRMLQTALDARFPDGSLRFVQPLATWRIEQAESNAGLILRLGTHDGFEVAFSLNNHDAALLGTALVAAPDMQQSRRPN